jgi:succinylarginine dihydrolase
MLIDLQLEGLPGPTSFHGGLSPGNLASQANAGARSHPRASARQCLAKMRQLLALDAPVALLPPLPRPDAEVLRRLGFQGSDAEVIAAAGSREPQLLRLAASSAAMWAANCATVIPASDSADHATHLVPANLIAMPHRAFEAGPRTRMLRRLFADGQHYTVHEPLPASAMLGDEGAANHHRAVGARGACHLFVHGRAAATAAEELPRRHAPRQWREASAAVARLGRLGDAVHARQHPDAVDAGAFHNDVVMIGHGDRLLLHAQALVDQPAVLAQLQERAGPLAIAEIGEAELPLAQAVRSYLFNSVMIGAAAGGPAPPVLLAPIESAEGPARRVVDRLVGEGFIARCEFIDLRESMMGGGGPACLRLRVPLAEEAIARLPAGFRIDAARLLELERWVDRHYRRELALADLQDPQLAQEGRAALDELTQLLGVGALYRFQGGVV